MPLTVKDAERIAREFWKEKNYEEIDIYSCKPIRPGGYKVNSGGKKSGKTQYDELEIEMDDKGEVFSYDISPGMEVLRG